MLWLHMVTCWQVWNGEDKEKGMWKELLGGFKGSSVSRSAAQEGVSGVKQSLGFPNCSCFLGAGNQRPLKWADFVKICISTTL